MPLQAAAEEPYTWSFSSRIAARDGRSVELEPTYFYAEGGGQPADRGSIDGIEVVAVRHVDGRVMHELAEEPPFETGDPIQAEIDRSFRSYCMRAHTASHVLFGAGRRLLEDLGYGGFDIGDRKVRLDLATDTPIDDGTLAELERLANRAVWESRPVTWSIHETESVRGRDEVAFNTKTQDDVFDAGTDDVRLVTIGEPTVSIAGTDDEVWDVAACGGTHVRNTREIGPIAVLDRSNPGEGLVRLELAVGQAALSHHHEVRRAADRAAGHLGTGVVDLASAVERLEAERSSASDRLSEVTGRLIDARLERLREEVIEHEGHRWLVGAVEDVPPDRLADQARGAAGDLADVVVLAVEDDATTVVVASDGPADAAEIVEDLVETFGGGGGGSDRFAQAGGIQADTSTVLDALPP